MARRHIIHAAVAIIAGFPDTAIRISPAYLHLRTTPKQISRFI
jgi:hypothetical protein